MALKEFVGGAQPTRLASTLASGGTISFAVDAATGATFPTGATAPFVVVIGRGTDSEEKILVTSRTGDTFSGLTRGYDDTSDVTHAAQSVVEHVLDSDTIAEANAHANDDTRDDHSQYLTAGRHDLVARHTFGVAYGTPAVATDITEAASAAGTGDNPAREDHVHGLWLPKCILYKSGTQSVPVASNVYVTWELEEEDTDGFHDTGSNPDRLTFPFTGFYQVDLSLGFSLAGVGFSASMYLNAGATQISAANARAESADFISPILKDSLLREFTAGDYIRIGVFRTPAGAATISSGIAVTRLQALYVGV